MTSSLISKQWKNAKYYTCYDLMVIEVPADDIYISQVGGKTLRQAGVYGINGTFFDTPNPEPTCSTWGVAIYNGIPIGENAYSNDVRGRFKRATMIYREGKITSEYFGHVGEHYPLESITWAIGGVGLYPIYDPIFEKVPVDIMRKTHHTAIACRGNTVFLIVSKKHCTLANFQKSVVRLKIDSAVALDGGGSTQMYFAGNVGVHSTRRLNNIIGIK